MVGFVSGVSAAAAPSVSHGSSLPARATELLARRCLSCHGPAKKAGGIDLSTYESAARSGIAGAGNPGKGRLIRAIESGRMPPAGRLGEREKQLLVAWATAAIPYPAASLQSNEPAPGERRLWSLAPIRRPRIPFPVVGAAPANPIDHFVFRRLAERKLRPNPSASRPELLRRVTFDLTGLPPTPEELAAFQADTSADAYQKVVDRLLASPAYGERWARHWLDVVRFGESHGYEQNHLRPNAWPYRDYVIRSFNQDKPYPRFVMEQLAGDALAPGDPDVEPATGFLVAGIHDTVGISTEEGRRQQRANDLDDMVATTGEAFLALTFGCARCHDHKFDPISQQDYYRLAAAFAGVRHGEREIPRKPSADARAAQGAAEPARAELRQVTNELRDLTDTARLALLRRRAVTPVLRPAVTATRNVEEFPTVRARFVRFTILATIDGEEPCLDELEVYGPDGSANLALASRGAVPTASSLLPGHPIHQIRHLNDGQYGNSWSWISRERGSGWAQVDLGAEHEIRRVVWSRDSDPEPRFADRIPREYRVELSNDGKTWQAVADGTDRSVVRESLTAADLEASLGQPQRERLGALKARQEVLRRTADSGGSGSRIYAGQFAAPDAIFVLKRGDVMQRGEEVQPGTPAAIPPLRSPVGASTPPPPAPETPGEPERRLALARWLTDRANPLTARVIVNRVWQHHFGKGLVATPSDFGNNGGKPTHPELLDWLAATFVAPPPGDAGQGTDQYGCGGRLKALHRLIVTSYTYRQSSGSNAAGERLDSANELLGRMPLRRLEAEAVRDAILAVSGKLDRSQGGPGFRLYKYRTVNVAIYEPETEQGPATWRRGIYSQAARGIRDDLLGTFDCPESAQRSPRRASTTTALQALSLLNGPFVQQQCGFIAERVASEAGPRTDDRVRRAFLRVLGRLPAASEAEAAIALVDRHGLTPLCRALVNSNEFLYY
jgi:hypothetical protein